LPTLLENCVVTVDVDAVPLLAASAATTAAAISDESRRCISTL
jgi:hypothetical protein